MVLWLASRSRDLEVGGKGWNPSWPAHFLLCEHICGASTALNSTGDGGCAQGNLSPDPAPRGLWFREESDKHINCFSRRALEI